MEHHIIINKPLNNYNYIIILIITSIINIILFKIMPQSSKNTYFDLYLFY